jgi:hypothetical protein
MTAKLLNNSRDLDWLVPELKIMALAIMDEARLRRIYTAITSTARVVQCQYALYAQGRNPLEYVNMLRKAVGLPLITEKENQKKVTWTLKSKHLVNLDDQDPDNNFSEAFDFVVISNNVAVWDIKADYNENELPDYEEVGSIAESHGLIWGGRWKNPDCCHIQLA